VDLAEALAEFRSAALARAEALRGGAELARAASQTRRLEDAFSAIASHGEEGMRGLRELLRDPSPDVWLWAAAELLSRGPDLEATRLLEDLAASHGLHAIDARLTLDLHARGGLRSPFARG
jgi:hypothetical protein